MVIHTKKKPRLHLHTGKKAVLRKKAENTSVTVKRRKVHPGFGERMAESRSEEHTSELQSQR